MRLLILFFVCFTIAISDGNAQNDSIASKASTFSTNGGRIFWMGANYRKEWNTPVNAPVFNMSKEQGGLTPIKRGGGKQTKSLRFEDANGREYTLRSIQKFITDKTSFYIIYSADPSMENSPLETEKQYLLK